jgi:hypothetical protein
MLLIVVTRQKSYRARRQARKEKPLLISPNLGALCAFARDTFFPTFFFIPKFQISLAGFLK